jgi:hypothetical protein
VSEQPQTSPVQTASAVLQNSGTQVAARVEERPELGVGVAFAGGFLLALILKRLAH